MATDWYYSKNGSKYGPVASAELKALARAGKLMPTDLVWKEGVSSWKPAANVKGLFAAAPPPIPLFAAAPPPIRRAIQLEPPPVESTFPEPTWSEVTPAGPAFDWPSMLLWVYRVLLAVAVVGIASPWYAASTEISAPLIGSGGSQTSATGLSIAWGVLSLLLLLGGWVMSFLTRIWKVHCGLAAAAFGLVVVAAVQLSSGPFGVNAQSSFGGATATARAGLAWGVWLTLLASGVAAGAAYLAGVPAAAAIAKRLTRRQLKLAACVLAVLSVGVISLQFMDSVKKSDGSTAASHQLSEVEARRRLSETANKYEGLLAIGVKNGLDRLDNDRFYSISTFDEYMGNVANHRFTPEPMAAYRVWRAAWMAEKGALPRAK